MSSQRTKYPRTPHLPGSPGADEDDIGIAVDAALFDADDVVVTLKMDGENTSVYPDGSCHARSANSGYHPSRSWMLGKAAEIGLQIPDGWRVCGENLFAAHSIRYEDLDDWFYLFSVWDSTREGGSTGYFGDVDGGVALDWDTTVEWASRLGVPTVEVIYRGPWDRAAIEAAFDPHRATHEGWVARVADEFRADKFAVHVGKWVRAGHVQTDQHWMHAEVTPNGRRAR